MRNYMNYMNSYEIHKRSICDNSCMYYSSKEIFGKPVKCRLFKKWRHRYIRERNRSIKLFGNQKENKIYFGKIVYTFCFKQNGSNKLAFTCKPKCEHSKSFSFNYAKIMK